MIKQTLDQKLQQKLSRLQIQTIKLLELPLQDLEQRVRQEIEENPVLDADNTESTKEVSLENIKEDDYIPSYKLKVSNWGPDARPEYNTFSVKESFTQTLIDQLGFKNLTEKQYAIACFIVGSLDQKGYLNHTVAELTDDMAFRAGIDATDQEVEEMIGVVQELEPSGICARDLRECLLLQLRDASSSPATELAKEILTNEYEAFTSRHFSKIMSRLGVSQEELNAAIKRITRLNPAPGGQAEDAFIEQSQQIIPDFTLTEQNGVIGFEMTKGSVPELRISRKYEDMLRDAQSKSDREQKETATFIKSKMDSAKWFVEALKQRQNTLRKTMQAILDHQYAFFQSGDEKDLRPLILETIADATGFDISTISRVVNSKYIETPYGIYQLKYFFSEKLVNKAGEEVSTREVKSVIQDIVEAEDKNKPLTDEQLVEELSRKGYNVARRTVAKYRDQLGIPLARLRKEF